MTPSPNATTTTKLAELCAAGTPLAWCETVEDWMLLRLARELPSRPAVWSWTCTTGLERLPGPGAAPQAPAGPTPAPGDADAVQALIHQLERLRRNEGPTALSETGDWILVMRDAVSDQGLPGRGIRLLKDLYTMLLPRQPNSQQRRMILLTGIGWTPPPALSGLIATFSLPLPTEAELRKLVAPEVKPLEIDEFATRARGLSEPAGRALARLIRHIGATGGSREDALARVNAAKTEGIRATQVLDIVMDPPDVRLGGYQNFQRWFQRRRPFMLAPDNPQTQPRGVLLLGFPGCGKTLAARWVAHQLGVPLVTMDLGRVMDRWVGSSEARMREALRTLEAAAPVVLFIDEIEKGMGGAGTDSSGVTNRLVGQLLTWLQDQQRPIFVIATCNTANLQPELTRAGRFDALFVVRPPSDAERAEILDAVSGELGLRLSTEVRSHILAVTGPSRAGYTGAELRQILVEACYFAGRGTRELSIEDVRRAMPYVTPLVQRPDGQLLLERYSPGKLTGYLDASETE